MARHNENKLKQANIHTASHIHIHTYMYICSLRQYTKNIHANMSMYVCVKAMHTYKLVHTYIYLLTAQSAHAI